VRKLQVFLNCLWADGCGQLPTVLTHLPMLDQMLSEATSARGGAASYSFLRATSEQQHLHTWWQANLLSWFNSVTSFPPCRYHHVRRHEPGIPSCKNLEEAGTRAMLSCILATCSKISRNFPSLHHASCMADSWLPFHGFHNYVIGFVST